jgi:ferrous-iron efflux pump FieF
MMTESERRRIIPLAMRAALFSVGMACFLLVLKGFAAWHTGSVAMLGSLADTGLDLLASIVTLYGVKLAAEPADHDHRFGHGKAEALAALFQVGLITASAVGIGWRAVLAYGNPTRTQDADIGIGVSIVAIGATMILLAYQRRVIRQTGSVAILADNIHYQSDVLLNGSVIVALVLDQFLGFRGADPLFGIAIALWLGWGAIKASSNAIDQLMDKEWPEERRQQFLDAAARLPALTGLHDLRTRSSGTQDFVQFHVWVAPDMTVAEAHRITEAAEIALRAEFPDTEILIHLDPQGNVDKEGVLPRAIAEEPLA